jgi:phenylacetate-CoA ligase
MKITPLEPWILQKIGNNKPQLLRTELEAYQLSKLRQVLQMAREKSTFYKKHLARAPGTINQLEDLAQFPFTTADDLRREGLQFLAISQSEIQRVVTLDTSGTTGSPKRLYYTRQDQELTIDFFQHGMSTFTGQGDRVMILLPHERPGSVGDLLASGLHRIGAFPIRYGPVRDPKDANAVLKAENATILVGVPTHVLAMARFWETDGQVRPSGPHSILLSTDHVPQAIVSALETTWDCRVYNHYGMTEMGLGGGVECQARRGYHLREADLYFEVIEPETGKPVAEGEHGELVFTTLTRHGMPLIRYRTGDMSRWIPGNCPCGTVLKTMDCVRHRLSEQVIIGRNSRTSKATEPVYTLGIADLDEVLFAIPQVLNFTATLTAFEGLDFLEVKVIVLKRAGYDLAGSLRQALDLIPGIHNLRETGNLRVDTSIQEYGEVQMGSMGKRAILDKRGLSYAGNLA